MNEQTRLDNLADDKRTRGVIVWLFAAVMMCLGGASLYILHWMGLL